MYKDKFGLYGYSVLHCSICLAVFSFMLPPTMEASVSIWARCQVTLTSEIPYILELLYGELFRLSSWFCPLGVLGVTLGSACLCWAAKHCP